MKESVKVSIKNYFDSIDFEKLSRERYVEELSNFNNFSYWYPKVKDCGISMVKSWYYTIPYDIWDLFRTSYEDKRYINECISYIKEIVEQNNELTNYIYNIKNGCFSNKFNAADCNVEYSDIAEKFLNIQHTSFEYETDGMCEFVIREYISFDPRDTLTIYNGLPLRPEFRVFVDFDSNEVLYIVNYWDYDYCRKGMRTANDVLVFDTMKNELNDKFMEHQDKVVELIKSKLLVHNAKRENNLKGKWSVDIMLDERDDTFYLIDMAIAHKSAYWNPNRNDSNSKMESE